MEEWMSSKKHGKSENGGLSVFVRNNDVDRAIRQLKKKINADGLFKELREKEFYEQPSVKRRRQKAEAVNRWRKTERAIREEF